MLVLTHRFEQQAVLRKCLEMMGEGKISPHQIAAAFNQGSTIQGRRLFPEMFPLDRDIPRIRAVTSNSLGAQRHRDKIPDCRLAAEIFPLDSGHTEHPCCPKQLSGLERCPISLVKGILNVK